MKYALDQTVSKTLQLQMDIDGKSYRPLWVAQQNR